MYNVGMYTTEVKPSEVDARIRIHMLLLATKFFPATYCTIDTNLGEFPIDKFTLRFPGGSATGSYRQISGALFGAQSQAEFVADCRMAGILDELPN
jgi:hypothetical protein